MERRRIDIRNMDCVEAMKEMKDNQFSIAIFEPRRHDKKESRTKNKWRNIF